MESIRSDEARNKLRKTSGPPEIPLQRKMLIFLFLTHYQALQLFKLLQNANSSPSSSGSSLCFENDGRCKKRASCLLPSFN